MEYEELQSMWNKYDNRLNNLESMNKQIMLNMLLSKPQKKLKWIKLLSVYELIAPPIILLIVMFPQIKEVTINTTFFIGSALVVVGMIYVSYIQINTYTRLRRINLETDTVIESAKKISNFKSRYNTLWKHIIVYYPLVFAGFTLITWKSFYANTGNIIFIALVFIITYALNIRGPRIHRERIERLENDIANLKEYID